MKTLSIPMANRLYLLTMVLVVIIGSIIQSITFSWGLLTTEIFLIFLPTWWILRKNRIPIRESMGFDRPRGSLVLVALMLGSGAWMVDSIIESFMVQITGYNIPTPANMLPTTPFQAALVILALAVAAPICEEFLFRGAIQRAYLRAANARTAIVIASLMFVMYHLRFQGFLALIPIAFILGYTYWRTRSIIIVMIVHFANNILSAIVLVQYSLYPEIQLPIPSLPAAAFGILLVIVGLVLLHRLTPTPAAVETGNEETEKEEAATGRFFRSYWPVAAAILIFLSAAVLEVLGANAFGEPSLNAASLPAEASWQYEVRHKGGEPVGQANCRLRESEDAFLLNCDRSIRDFEVQVGNSFFSSLEMNTNLQVSWRSEDLSLIFLNQINRAKNFTSNWVVQPIDGDLRISVQTNGGTPETLTFPSNAFLEDEWAWRLIGLPFDEPQIWGATFVSPLVWREETENSGPVAEDRYIVIAGEETISVPAGEFTAYQVVFGNNQAAWYDVNSPHTPLLLETTMFDFYLLPPAE